MKLPEDSEERKKILLLIGIGVITLGYVGFNFVLSPYFKSKKARQAQIEKVERKIWLAKRDIHMIPENLDKNNNIISEILDVSDNKRQILKPDIANHYLLPARNVIEQQAQRMNLSITEIREIPHHKPPNGNDEEDPNGPRFEPYTVNVSLQCSFYEFSQLLKALEDNNPYLCITRIGVIGQPDNVMKHAVTFDVEWPVWIDVKQPIKLVAQQMIAKRAKEEQ